MKVEVPYILIARRTVVLAGGDALAPERAAHGLRHTPRGTKEVAAKVVRNVQDVLMVASGYHQAVAFYPGVVVKRDECEDVGIHQHNGCFRRGRWKRPGDGTERTRVSRGSMLHEALRMEPGRQAASA